VNRAFVVAGCALLVARPALLHLGPPTLVITLLFSALLMAALKVGEAAGPGRLVVPVLVAGIVAMAVGRLAAGGHAPAPLTMKIFVLNSLAAVAEEAFFRRAVYAALAPAGAAVAIGGAAILFAMVHVTVYGAWVLPIDAAAGLLFGWQRWASRSWKVPALTHLVANVLVVV
jgi:hypothetical protein